MKNKLLLLSLLFCILSGMFFYKGFDVKTNYYNSENYGSLNKNAYVGGDAYNYIINGTYFTGYMVIGSTCLLASVILGCTHIITERTLNKEQDI